MLVIVFQLRCSKGMRSYEKEVCNVPSFKTITADNRKKNRPFARSGHLIRNKLHWEANNAVGLPKHKKAGLDW